MRTGRTILLTLALSIVWVVHTMPAQNTWTGSAVAGRYGEFPPGGLFAASNTFPLNSLVDVTHDASGDTVRVIVIRRIEDPGVFMLLSEEAASELRIRRGTRASVSAQPVQMPGLTAISPNWDLPFHPDPDINPGAILGDPNRDVFSPPDLEPAGAQPDPEPAPRATAAPEDDRDPHRDFDPVPPDDLLVLRPDLTLPEVQSPAILEQPLPRIAPPAQPPLVVTPPLPSDPNGLTPRLVRPADPEEIADPLQARLAEIERALAGDRVRMDPLGADEVIEPEIVLVPPTPPDPDPDVDLPLVAVKDDAPDVPPARPVRPARIPDDALLSLEPAEFRAPPVPDPPPAPAAPPTPEAPPEPELEPEPEPEPEPAPAREPVTPEAALPIVATLDSGAYYVQVAAMSNPDSALQTVARLNGAGEGLPVAVTTRKNGERDIFRVFVGPLSEDERGTALHTVRSHGFRDAFLRRE